MSIDPNVPHPELQTELESAAATLDGLKAKCTNACVDEAIHAPHRAELESAYVEVARLSRLVAGPTDPRARPNVEVIQEP
jgi:hypothetical protein